MDSLVIVVIREFWAFSEISKTILDKSKRVVIIVFEFSLLN